MVESLWLSMVATSGMGRPCTKYSPLSGKTKVDTYGVVVGNDSHLSPDTPPRTKTGDTHFLYVDIPKVSTKGVTSD
jgi:hypothetical protein